ncbi:MAG TPA: hypothetical protein VFB00_05170, partial [Terriglobales bacterium]|nr:hypothetical protein [Terriglobales bacterium]
MKNNRSWLSLLGFCFVAALGSALAFAAIVAGGSVALASHQNEVSEGSVENATAAPTMEKSSDRTFSGMITDSHCGARHMRNSYQNSAECARGCFRKG